MSLRPIVVAILALGCTPTGGAPATPPPARLIAPSPPAATSSFAAMPSFGPISGRSATSVVVMLHGYGANGADLRSVAQSIAQALPDTVFLLPDGIEPLPGSPDGRQWFPLAGSDDSLRHDGLRHAAAQLVPWIDHELRTRALARSRLGLVGFSQGAMLALDLGLHLNPAPAGVVSLSGRLLDDTAPSAAPAPMLIVHGTSDERIPVAAAREAIARLGQLHIRTASLILPGVGHTITPQGIAAAESFLHGLWP